jgi:hypothetical protein
MTKEPYKCLKNSWCQKSNSELEQVEESNSWRLSKKEHSHTYTKTRQKLTRIMKHYSYMLRMF